MIRDERGAAALEFVLVVPMLVLFIGLVVGGGRLWYARASVERLADSAARSASLARTPHAAEAAARRLVELDAAASDLRCAGGVGTTVDTSGFAVPVGRPATVGVRVGCAVPLSDLALPGLPGVVHVESSATSVLDRYRGRR